MRSRVDPAIEIVNKSVAFGHARYALFDFDGTLSLIRSGWQKIMTSMMVEVLKCTPLGQLEAVETLEAEVVAYITRLTGRQTIYQMIRLCEEVNKRKGESLPPLEYKRDYHARLTELIGNRIVSLQDRTVSPEKFLVPFAYQFLASLHNLEAKCFLASGTDEVFVEEEVRLLGIRDFFFGIYGALDDWTQFSKRKVIRNLVIENGLRGEEFVSFGDGFVEIEETKAVGGIAVGVASDELNRCGIDPWKRKRLIEAGADVIIPDFSCYEQLSALLFV